MPEAIRQKFLDEAKNKEHGVFPENWPAVQLFLSMQTQWHTGMSGAIGLNYAVLPVVEKATGIRAKGATFYRLQLLESEVLSIWAKKPSS